jgi:hypothetical protein
MKLIEIDAVIIGILGPLPLVKSLVDYQNAQPVAGFQEWGRW